MFGSLYGKLCWRAFGDKPSFIQDYGLKRSWTWSQDQCTYRVSDRVWYLPHLHVTRLCCDSTSFNPSLGNCIAGLVLCPDPSWEISRGLVHYTERDIKAWRQSAFPDVCLRWAAKARNRLPKGVLPYWTCSLIHVHAQFLTSATGFIQVFLFSIARLCIQKVWLSRRIWYSSIPEFLRSLQSVHEALPWRLQILWKPLICGVRAWLFVQFLCITGHVFDASHGRRGSFDWEHRWMHSILGGCSGGTELHGLWPTLWPWHQIFKPHQVSSSWPKLSLSMCIPGCERNLLGRTDCEILLLPILPKQCTDISWAVCCAVKLYSTLYSVLLCLLKDTQQDLVTQSPP